MKFFIFTTFIYISYGFLQYPSPPCCGGGNYGCGMPMSGNLGAGCGNTLNPSPLVLPPPPPLTLPPAPCPPQLPCPKISCPAPPPCPPTFCPPPPPAPPCNCPPQLPPKIIQVPVPMPAPQVSSGCGMIMTSYGPQPDPSCGGGIQIPPRVVQPPMPQPMPQPIPQPMPQPMPQPLMPQPLMPPMGCGGREGPFPLGGGCGSPRPPFFPPPINDCCCNCAAPCAFNIQRSHLRSAFASKTFNAPQDPKCNQKELKLIIRKYISDDLDISKRLIQKAAQEQLEKKYNVICGNGTFSFVVFSDSFCQHTVDNVTCYVFHPIA
uniref:Ground-like domain-containing protein n=1 Tax=Strongyloides papillosus TaxID=174720 RepID=A0A0N5CB04_STREA